MTITQAIAIVTQALKTNSYGEARIRDGIAWAGTRFLRETGTVRKLADKTCTPGSSTLDTSTITDFRPERLQMAYVTANKEGLMVYAASAMLRMQQQKPCTGTPKGIAWITDTSAELWPTPSTADTIRIIYSQPLIDVVNSSGGTTINIPDEYLHDVLRFGATAATEHNDPDALYADKAFQRFEDFIQQIKGRVHPVGVLDPNTREYL